MSKKAYPDAQIFPHATGVAEGTVAKHQKEENLKLYAGWFCPFVQRAWLVLEEKKIPYQYVEVNPYHKEESFLKLNPRGLVPTLEFDNKPLYESTVICEFLEDQYPDHTPKLLPSDAFVRARMRIWVDFFTSRVITSYHKFLQFQGDEAGLQIVREAFLDSLKQFTEEMDKEGPYFLGKDICMLDLIAAPWAKRLWVFDHFKGGLKMPTEGAVWARWRKWSDAITSRPSVVNTTSDHEHSIPIYSRYADDTAQSAMANATRRGEAVP